MKHYLVKSLQNSINKMKGRGWDRLYIFVDVHETLLKPTWDKDVLPKEFYDHAIETMQEFTKNPHMIMVIYTSSHKTDIDFYLDLCKKQGIEFSYINDNPEVVTNEYGDYTKKPYMNLLIDDKAGFDPRKDWLPMRDFLRSLKP